MPLPHEFLPGTIVLVFTVVIVGAAIVLGRLELRRQTPADAAIEDFFELSPEEIDAEWWLIVDANKDLANIPIPRQRPGSDDVYDIDADGGL